MLWGFIVVGREKVFRHAGQVVWLQWAEEQAGSTVDAAMQSRQGREGQAGLGAS